MSFALIIEDEMIVAFSVEEALGQLGNSLFEIATSVEHAIKAAKSRCPDLIVSDHRITGGTGTDAVLAICSDKTIPVAFVTASGHEIRERLPEALISEKPFTLLRLTSAVRAAIDSPFRHVHGNPGPQLCIVE